MDHLKTFQKTFNSVWSWKSHKTILNDAIDKNIRQSDQYKNAKTDADRQKIYNRLKNDQKFIDSVKEKETAVQVGFVVIDPKTGHIKAMVGQNPNFPFKYGLNHVTQIQRQAGSSFKPFVYATAIDNGYSRRKSLGTQGRRNGRYGFAQNRAAALDKRCNREGSHGACTYGPGYQACT